METITQSAIITTYSGKEIDLLNFKVTDIEIVDIAKGLSNECRWGGQTPYHYSVAAHSLFVANRFFDVRKKLIALLHDAPEYILKDIPKPLKNLLPEYVVIEKRLAETIYKRFNIIPLQNELDEIKYMDKEVEKYEFEKMFIQKSETLKFSVNSQYKKYKEELQMAVSKYYDSF